MVDPLPLDPSTEAAVFDAARQVLAEQWAPSLTLHAVAERAGVELERLYSRWPRPASLLAEMLGRAGAIADIPDLGDTRQELSVALHQMIGAYTERPYAERTLLRLALTVNHDGDELVRVRELGEQHWRGKVVAALHRAVARGDLPPEADAELIVDIWAGAIAYRRTFRGDPLDATVVEVLLDLVLSGRVPLQLPELPEPPADAWPEPLTDALNWLSGIPVGRMFGIADGVPYRLLEQAPERRTVIGGHPVTVTAGVARNFMPVKTEQRSRMSAGVAVDAEGAGMLPPFLRADRIVVLHGDDVWVAPLDEEFLAARSSRGFRAVARLGPTWTPGEQVDIVVRLVGHGGVARLVRVSGQLIGRSD